MDENGGAREGALGFCPLYRQVPDVLIKHIVDGVWRPVKTLLSETGIATDLRVSRKALNPAEKNLVLRCQGKGTFEARHDEEHILFKSSLQLAIAVASGGLSLFATRRT